MFNDSAILYQKGSTIDAYGQPQTTYTLKSTQSCRWRHLNGNEKHALGKDIEDIMVRFYLNPGVLIDETYVIVNRDLRYQVIWVNRLGNRGGLCAGIQVDVEYLGFCSEAFSSSSSSSSSSEAFSSSSSSSSSSSEGYSSSSSSSSEGYSSSSSSSSSESSQSSSSSSSESSHSSSSSSSHSSSSSSSSSSQSSESSESSSSSSSSSQSSESSSSSSSQSSESSSSSSSISSESSSSESSSSSSSSSSESSNSSSSSSSEIEVGWTWGEQFPVGTTAEEWTSWKYLESPIEARNTGDWGNMELECWESFVSPVMDSGGSRPKMVDISYDDYSIGQGGGTIMWRGSDTPFAQDDVLPAWIVYTVPVATTFRYIQIRTNG